VVREVEAEESGVFQGGAKVEGEIEVMDVSQ